MLKAKTHILAIIAAIVSAVSCAFILKKADRNDTVRVWIKQTSTSAYVCTPIHFECRQQLHGALCTVSIVLTNGSTKDVSAFDDSSCSIQLKDGVSGPTYHVAYDAGIGDRPFDAANSAGR